MAEKYLGDLLEELDYVSYSRLVYKSKPRFTVGDLIKKHIPKGLIIDAFAEDLIRDANNPHRPQTFSNNIDNSIPCILTITGFQYLNQIRIKKSIEDLNDSIDAFKKSSDSAFSQLDDSINKFNESSEKSSKEMIDLTRAIYFFTVIVVIFTTYTITKDLVYEKTLALIPFLNTTFSALVYAGIIDIFVTLIFLNLINYFKRK